MKRNNSIDFSQFVKKFLQSEIALELESHVDELSSTRFYFQIDDNKKVFFHFLNKTFEFHLENNYNLSTLEKTIHSVFSKEGYGVKFCKTEKKVECLTYFQI